MLTPTNSWNVGNSELCKRLSVSLLRVVDTWLHNWDFNFRKSSRPQKEDVLLSESLADCLLDVSLLRSYASRSGFCAAGIQQNG